MADNPFDQFDQSAAAAAPVTKAADNPFDQFDTPPAAKDAAAPPETAGRVAGLGERALIQGVGHLVDTPGALVSLADRAGASVHDYTRKLFGLQPNADPVDPAPTTGTDLTTHAADTFGLPKPETPAERVGTAAVSALPSAILAPEAPIAGALSAAGGAGGSAAAKEAGAGPWGQFAAGLATGSVPAIGAAAASGARGLVRGGAQGQAKMQGNLADAAASGTNLTAGQAGGNPLIQYLEGTLSKLWGGHPITKAAQEQTANIGSHVDRIVDNLSGGNEVSPMSAGAGIVKGVGDARTPGTAFGNMRAAEKAAYAKVDTLVPPQTPIDVSGTLGTLGGHAAPIPGAAQITSLTSPKLTTLNDEVNAAVTANGSSTLPYEAATALKTKLGNSIDWGFAPADPVTNGALKQVHTALKGDIDNGAAVVSPQAHQAVTDARQLYAANQETRDALNPIINAAGGPEKVYSSAINGTKEGATKITQVMSAINPAQQNLVRATVMDKLGRASAAQDAPFNANTFLTNWTKLDPNAKDALFGASGTTGSLRANLDSLTKTIGNIKSGTKLPNPSGSGEAVGHGAGVIALWEGLTHAMQGDPHTLIATAGGVAANNLLSRALTNPRTVQWLAQSTKVPVSALPNAVNQLAKLGQSDPDARDLAAYLSGAQTTDRPQRANGGKVDNEALVQRLVNRWKAAKRSTDETTKPLLNVHDDIIAKALSVAGRTI